MSDTFTPPRGFGRIPDKHDPRDYKFRAIAPNITNIPQEVNLEKDLPSAVKIELDQYDVGSCGGWSAGQLYNSVLKKDGHHANSVVMPSPVFLYYNARLLEDTVNQDAGVQIRDVHKAANKYGFVSNKLLKPAYGPANVADDNYNFPTGSVWSKAPSKALYTKAQERLLISYHRLDTIAELLQCLADGWCVNVGIDIFRSFYDDFGNCRKDVPDPGPNETALGGHAVVIYGYSLPRQRFFFRNQYGATAHEGTPNFTQSFKFMQEHSADWWTARLIKGGKA